MPLFFVALSALGIGAIGWSAWTGDTLVAQALVLISVLVLVVVDRKPSLTGRETIQRIYSFFSGAGIGLLAYQGEVPLLLGAMWAALYLVIENQIRGEFRDFLTWFKTWLGE